MPTVTRLTTKHQTTIPLEVRRVLGLEAGDQVEFQVEGSHGHAAQGRSAT